MSLRTVSDWVARPRRTSVTEDGFGCEGSLSTLGAALVTGSEIKQKHSKGLCLLYKNTYKPLFSRTSLSIGPTLE